MKMIQYDTRGHYIRADLIERLLRVDDSLTEIHTAEGKTFYSDLTTEELAQTINQECAGGT